METTTKILQHQKSAVDKLLPIRVGALFMEQGTGKSRTAIELIARRQAKIWNVVWFCPVSLKQTIRGEILKHTSDTPDDIYVFNGTTRIRNIFDVDWYIVGIESMSASKRIISAANSIIRKESCVIVDESSYIKGHQAARTNWITDISQRAQYRLILTGTPISQGVEDLFAQMRFLSPKILGYRSFYSFSANHLEYSEKYPDLIIRAHNTKYLASKIQPYVYQVTKAECLELPPKAYQTERFNMTDSQRNLYERVKDEILDLYLYRDDLSSYMIFQLFSSLQQVVSGFWNNKLNKSKGPHFIEIAHNRVAELQNIIDYIKNKKMIIWAKFQYDIKEISKQLRQEYGDNSVALYYGGLNEKQRNAEINKFKDSARFLIATPSTAGHGLTVNEAEHIIFYNNGFKYSERIQAEDRCHRIGQDKQITYTDIVCADSIDERIGSALAGKGNAVQEFKQEVDKVKNKKKGQDRLKKLIKSL